MFKSNKYNTESDKDHSNLSKHKLLNYRSFKKKVLFLRLLKKAKKDMNFKITPP